MKNLRTDREVEKRCSEFMQKMEDRIKTLEIKKNMVNRWTDGLPVEVVTLLKSIFGANVLNN
jgi:hypothetical protein